MNLQSYIKDIRMKTLEKNIINLYGAKGKRWLDNLPTLIAQIAKTYGLSHLKPVEDLSHHYVLSGFQGSLPIILKLGLDVDSLKREATALTAFSGLGTVKVLSENNGLLLLECAIPGVSLKTCFPKDDDKAIDTNVNVIKRLHQAPIPRVHIFHHIKDWLMVLDNDLKIPIKYLQKARQLRDHLLKTSTKEVLLHGDLHHDNILQHGDNWVVIDPKGVVGESIYEVAAFIRNPIPELLADTNAQSIIHHRITRFAELLQLSEHRIRDWCFVQAVLAWTWVLEDNGDDAYFKDLTKIFENNH